MLRSLLVAFLFGMLSLSTGCGARPEESRLLPDSTMVRALVELHLAEARTRLVGTAGHVPRDTVLAHLQVDPDAFDRSLQVRSGDPEALSALYSVVLDSLSVARNATLAP